MAYIGRLTLIFSLSLTYFSGYSQQVGECYILKAWKGEWLQWTFEYDALNRISQTIQYDEHGKIVSRAVPSYEGSSTSIESITEFDSNGKPERYSVYKRDARQRVVRLEIFKVNADGTRELNLSAEYTNGPEARYCLQTVKLYTAGGDLMEVTEIQYTDPNGSYTSTKRNASGALNRTEHWTRDNHKNYDRWTAFPYQNVHNLTAKEIILADGTRAPSSFTSVFEYNGQGYPVKEINTTASGAVERYTYEYRCE